jgi:ribosome-binding protein aMBF1 (putative translation factor)
MSTTKKGSAKGFQELFEFKSQEEKRAHDGRMLMFRFLSEVEREMEAQGVTRKELAQAIGTSPSYITQLFRGDKMLNFPTIAKIQEALGIEFQVRKKGGCSGSLKNK